MQLYEIHMIPLARGEHASPVLARVYSRRSSALALPQVNIRTAVNPRLYDWMSSEKSGVTKLA